MINEEKKMLCGIQLTREEITEYRRKKFKEVRKGLGAGRPKCSRKKSDRTFLNDKVKQQLNQMRDKEIERLSNEIIIAS